MISGVIGIARITPEEDKAIDATIERAEQGLNPNAGADSGGGDGIRHRPSIPA